MDGSKVHKIAHLLLCLFKQDTLFVVQKSVTIMIRLAGQRFYSAQDSYLGDSCLVDYLGDSYMGGSSVFLSYPPEPNLQ